MKMSVWWITSTTMGWTTDDLILLLQMLTGIRRIDVIVRTVPDSIFIVSVLLVAEKRSTIPVKASTVPDHR